MNYRGLRVAQALVEAFGPRALSLVVGARDTAMLRDYFAELEHFCGDHHIPFLERSSAPSELAGTALSVGWRWLIAGAERLIVFHDSLLPKYRGFAPLTTALVLGDHEVGVTALYAVDEYDAGPIIGQRSMQIQYPLRIAEAIERISFLYAELAVEVVGTIRLGRLPEARPQDDSSATFSLWRDEEDYAVDWTSSSARIRALVDAVGFPFPGATTLIGDTVARLLQVEEIPDVNIAERHPGKVIFMKDGFPTVVCGSGLLVIRELVSSVTRESLLPLRKFRTRFH